MKPLPECFFKFTAGEALKRTLKVFLKPFGHPFKGKQGE
jgi:hypothetical protein